MKRCTILIFFQAYNPESKSDVTSRDIPVSTILQHGHTIPVEMEYHYAAIDKTEFS